MTDKFDKDHKEKKIRVFTFDAWAHEGDELRKSFLDELNYALNDQTRAKKVSADIWETKEITTIHHGSRLSFAAIFIGMLIVTVQGLSLFSSMEGNLPKLFEWFAYFPILWFAFTFIAMLILSAFSASSFKELYAESFGFLDSSQPTDEVNISKKSASSSLVEFTKKLKQILKAPKDKFSKLIIVIDNIDRLDGDKARVFWSSLTPFFEKTIIRNHGHSNLSLIIPYSREHIKNIFESDTSILKVNELSQLLAEGSPNKSGNDNEGYLQKTFDIIFYLRQPILHKWQKYLTDQLSVVFPDVVSNQSNGDLDAIIQIYKSHSSTGVSPRHIKKFVNTLNSEYRLAQQLGEIPITVTAYYVLNYKADNDGWLMNLYGPEKAILLSHPNVTDNNISLMLTALQYGVSMDDADVVLMESPIKIALRDNKPEVLEKFSTTNGFKNVVYKCLNEVLPHSPDEGADAFINIVECLFSAKITDESVWHSVINRVQFLQNWEQGIKHLRHTFEHILKNASDSQKTLFLDEAATLLRNIVLQKHSARFPNEGRFWYESADLIKENETEVSVPNDDESRLQVLLNWIKNNTGNLPFTYKTPHCDEFTILSDSDMKLSAIEVVRATHAIYSNKEFEIKKYYSASSIKRFESAEPNEYNVDQFIILMGMLVVFSSYENEEKLQENLINGNIYKRVFTDGYSTNSDAAALCFVATIIVDPNFSSDDDGTQYASQAQNNILQQINNGGFQDDVVEVIKKLFIEANAVEHLFNLEIENVELQNYCLKLLNEILNEEKSNYHITYNRLTNNSERLIDVDEALLSDNKQGYYRVLLRTTNLNDIYDQLISNDFKQEEIPLYLAALRIAYETQQQKEYILFIEKSLQEITSSDWYNEFSVHHPDTSNLITLLELVRENNDKYFLKHHATNALLEIAGKIINDGHDFEKYNFDTLHILQQSLSEENSKLFQTKLMKLVFNPQPKHHGVEEYDEHFSIMEFDVSHMDAVADDALQAALRWVEEEKQKDIRWFITFIAQFPNAHKNAIRANKINLSTELKNIVETHGDEALINVCIELMDQLKIKYTKKVAD